MMEEWHQKLHNNSSPDDLAICQALLDYLAAGQDLQVYWDSLAAQGEPSSRSPSGHLLPC
jgi:alpha-glucan,water dikinase